MNKKLKKKHTKFLVVYLAFITFLISFSLTIFFLDNHNTRRIVIEDKRDYNIITNTNNIIQNLKTKYNNDDIKGLITIPKANLDEIVVQTTDNDFYLSHNEYKEYDIHGSTTMDYRINPTNSRKILIYGHSSPYDSKKIVPFNELEEYYSYDYYKNHQTIILTLENEVRTYQIFSVYVETNDFTYMNLNFEDKDTWYQHLLKLKNKSLYNTNINIGNNDEILILQTCSNNKNYSQYKEKYLLIIAKKI